MEATIKLSQDEVVELCEQSCEALIKAPEGMKWEGTWVSYEGVTVRLVDDVVRPLVKPLVTNPVVDVAATDDEVAL